MRVAVIGAGIVGVCTAYELAAEGHEVTVFERRGSVAEEASFAHAGLLAPGWLAPWAGPGTPGRLLRQLLSRQVPVRLSGMGWLAELPWLWRGWRACRPDAHAAGRAAVQRLASLSAQRLQSLTRDLHLDYEQASGCLVLLRTPRELRSAEIALKAMEALGLSFRQVDAAEARRIEPGLNAETPLQAGIHLPHDGVGNCRHFAHLMKAQAQRLGARFLFGHEVRRIVPGARPQVELSTPPGQDPHPAHPPFDAAIVCAGVPALRLLQPLGLKLPLAAVHGYSITAPLRALEGHPHAGPQAAVRDAHYGMTISRLGQRVRVAGGAELGGRLSQTDPRAVRALYKVLDDWFPGVAAQSRVQPWKGARPMTPDGTPVIGASGLPGVWLNVGHGSGGWTLSCGSACVLADQLAGRPAGIDLTGLQLMPRG